MSTNTKRLKQHAADLDKMILEDKEARQTLRDNARRFKLISDLVKELGGTLTPTQEGESAILGEMSNSPT